MKSILNLAFVFLLVALFYALFNYQRSGDINTLVGKIQYKPKTSREILKKLHQLFVYNSHTVMWPLQLGIALFSAILLCVFFQRNGILEILLTTSIIFLSIDLPQRWTNTHVRIGASQEAAVMIGILQERIKSPRPPSSVKISL
jgi:uncharacterized membrane protein YjjP (DUF1212 family)